MSIPKDRSERGWLGVDEAGRYVGIRPDVIRRAIASGELPAYVKPATCREGDRTYYKISREDLDAWVRTWPSAREAMAS